MLGWISSLFRPSAVKAVEGEFRPGPYATLQGWLPDGAPWNAWQAGIDPQAYPSASSMVEACVGAYSQTIAMCPGAHWVTEDNGGRKRITNSALNRILRRPNEYQSISDFLLNLTRQLYEYGEAFALAQRNDRNEISALHLMRSNVCSARIALDGSIFYALGGNEIVDAMLGGAKINAAPSRDVLHIRLHTPRHPLKGESPIMAAALDVAAGGAMSAQTLAFFRNQSRPSGILKTDTILTPEQATALREAWNAQSQGWNAGKVPILTAGLGWQDVSQKNSDAQLAELMKLSEEHIALAFRVPLPILGRGGSTMGSTELLMQQWIASGLGFALNHIEEAFGLLFGLKGQPDEYLEFDTAALLRSAMKDRIEALAAGVIGGIYTPNEARRLEGLPDAVEGDQPRVQQQVVPLDWWKIQQDNLDKAAKAAEAAAKAPPPAAPASEQDNTPPAADAAASAAKSYRTARRAISEDA